MLVPWSGFEACPRPQCSTGEYQGRRKHDAWRATGTTQPNKCRNYHIRHPVYISIYLKRPIHIYHWWPHSPPHMTISKAQIITSLIYIHTASTKNDSMPQNPLETSKYSNTIRRAKLTVQTNIVTHTRNCCKAGSNTRAQRPTGESPKRVQAWRNPRNKYSSTYSASRKALH